MLYWEQAERDPEDLLDLAYRGSQDPSG